MNVPVLALVTLLSVAIFPSSSQQQPRGSAVERPPASDARAPDGHRTPKGWKFRWPKGDPIRGREAFAKLECHSCHEVRGEQFPGPTRSDMLGPELSQMGALHEPEYFAEALINPSAVIEKGKGYQAADGSSKMPSFNESMTVQEAIDLVAFLRALRPGPRKPGGHRGH
jgi:Cytochrome c